MANAEIRETMITPDVDGTIVRLRISDVPLVDEHTAATQLVVEIKVPQYETPMLAHLQQKALDLAIQDLQELRKKLTFELQDSHYPHPRPWKPKA